MLGPHAGGVVAIISQMITPAIFILACGNLVGSGIARLVRVVDRVREMASKLSVADLASFKRRAIYLERALIAYYGAIALFVVSSLLIALTVAYPTILFVPTITTILGAFSVLYGAMNSLLEVRIAAGMLRQEIERFETKDRSTT